MIITIIGTGNVGGALAGRFAWAGHKVILGVRDQSNFKGSYLVERAGISAEGISEAVSQADVVIIAAPAMHVVNVVEMLGDTTGKIIIDTMNIVGGNGPTGYENTTNAILEHTATEDVVKCFNTTGFENMNNPDYGSMNADMFVAGNSSKGKQVAIALAKSIGFEEVWDMGGNDKFTLMEQLASVWINLAIFQGNGRDIALKVIAKNN
jgi:predicted dinucleotide-binding enzyme